MYKYEISLTTNIKAKGVQVNLNYTFHAEIIVFTCSKVKL